MRNLKIGVMGCANFAERSAIPTILGCPEHFELVAVASRSKEKAESFGQRFGCNAVVGYDQLLADSNLDLIYMPLPTALHDQWVLACLDAGKHVIVEKSMAENLKSATAMVNMASDRNLLLSENFMFQHHRQIKFIRDLIDQGTIGKIQQLRSSFGFPPLPRDNFRFNKSLGGGALLDAGAYTLKASQLFLGPELTVQSASLVDTLDCDVDTSGAIHLTNSDGVSALLGFGFNNFYQCNIEIWGSEGKITATRAFTAKPDFSPQVIVEKQGSQDCHQIEPDDQFRNYLLAIHSSLSKNSVGEFASQALRQAQLISAVFEANE